MKVWGWKNIFPAKRNEKAEVAVHIDKTDFKMKFIIKDKGGHYVMKRGSIQKEHVIFLNYMHIIEKHLDIESKYYQTQREIDDNTVIVGKFNTPLT